jgi:CHAT domain-containing protein
VLICPDGALGRVPFAALPGSKPGSYLIEEVALATVPVPSALPALLAPLPGEGRLKPSLLVVGDVDHDSGAAAPAADGERYAPRGALKGWANLPATRAEAAAVKVLFDQHFHEGTVTDLRRGEARKGAVRAALGRHRHVHLATHGYFAPPELVSALDANAGRGRDGLFGQDGLSGWHPLLLSGIALAGANREPRPGEEDGILSALEVSELDLSKVELAVLSACQTGLGQETQGQGLLGLQRAFQAAGARCTVTSLWSVHDAATSVLMERFYQGLWSEKPLSKLAALRQAQLFVLRHPEAVERRQRELMRQLPGAALRGLGRKVTRTGATTQERSHPLYWGAFVLAGDWR